MNKQFTGTNYSHLSPEFISDFLYYFKKSKKNGNSEPDEKISLAIAFANLFINDPTDVTAHHRKMLSKKFNDQEINELVSLITEELGD